MHDASDFYGLPITRCFFSMSAASRHPLSHLARSKLTAIILIRLPLPYVRSSFLQIQSYHLSKDLQVTILSVLTARQISPKAIFSINTCPRRGCFTAYSSFSCSTSRISGIFLTVPDILSDTFYVCRSQRLLSKLCNPYYLRKGIIGIAPDYPGVSARQAMVMIYQRPAGPLRA